MHARVVLGVGKGVLFREVSSVQGFPYRAVHLVMETKQNTAVKGLKLQFPRKHCRKQLDKQKEGFPPRMMS